MTTIERATATPGDRARVPPPRGALGPKAGWVAGACFALAIVALGWPAIAAAQAPYRLGPERAEAPRRVVTLAPSLTEIMLELGEGGRLVGVSRYDDDPAVAALPRVGGYLDPSPEAILALRPELLLVEPSPGNRAVVERLAGLGVPVLVLPLKGIADTLVSVRAVGDALGRRDAGEALAARIQAALDGLRACAAPSNPTALIVYGWQPLVAAGPGSFADELLALTGARNAAASLAGPYPTLSAEAVLASRPDRILDASGGHGSPRPLAPLGANVVELRTTAFFRPGPRLVEAARELCAILRPADGRGAPSANRPPQEAPR